MRALVASEELASRWELQIGPPISGATCSIVRRVTSHDRRALVLKVPVHGEERTSGLYAALAFQDCGGISILRHDEHFGAVLMPFLSGVPKFADLNEECALQETVNLIRSLRRTQSFPATDIYDWFRFPNSDSRTGLLEYLLTTTTKPRYLHGDLHHDNILWNGARWVAIDPKGLLADPHYEPVAFLRNPAPGIAELSDLPYVLMNRIFTFSRDLDLDPWRVWAWAWLDLTTNEEGSPGPFTECWKVVASALATIGGEFPAPPDAARQLL